VLKLKILSPKCTSLAQNTPTDPVCWRRVQRCYLWARRRDQKRQRKKHVATNWLFAQTTHTSVFLLGAPSEAWDKFLTMNNSKWALGLYPGRQRHAGMAHSDCGLNVWVCRYKSVRSLENTCHTWALRWWFTKRRYIKCLPLLLALPVKGTSFQKSC